jgi:hypoxanthine phosphoribosyltransferase
MEIVQLHDKAFKKFISNNDIQLSIDKIAEKINVDYRNKRPIFIGVLNGSFLFSADLVKKFSSSCEVAFIQFSSYSGTKSTGNVKELMGLNLDIKNRDVIILEDIVDTGNTLEKLMITLKKHAPSSIKIATLLFKPKAYKKKIPIDYVAIEVGNEFLVGYGLDYDGIGRNLEHIYKIEE